jgi:bifunctional DNA-binding transcriptional regulator/antitoxin component of YhaV-PrlF toxin-antitoxin module
MSNVTVVEVSMNSQGRVLLPRELRQAAGIAPGDRLVASVEDGAVVLRGLRVVIEDVCDRYADISGAGVEELLAMRRADAAHL